MNNMNLIEFKTQHKNLLKKHTNLENEIVIEVTLNFVEMWVYEYKRPVVYNYTFLIDKLIRSDYSMNIDMHLN
ncbi:MAG: hypothetical protein PHD02_04395 [Bacilli bacterium]|nr:hypothetical protein [Bacilli bacterium]